MTNLRLAHVQPYVHPWITRQSFVQWLLEKTGLNLGDRLVLSTREEFKVKPLLHRVKHLFYAETAPIG